MSPASTPPEAGLPAGADGIEITVRGALGEYAVSLFHGFRVEVGDGTTVLRGTVQGEEELADLCRRVRDAGVDLVSLRRLVGGSPAAATSPSEVLAESPAPARRQEVVA